MAFIDGWMVMRTLYTHVMCNCASYPIDENRPFSLCTISVSSYFFLLLHAVLIYLHRAHRGKSKVSVIVGNRLVLHLMWMLIVDCWFNMNQESEKLRFSFEPSFSWALLPFFSLYYFCCKFMLYRIWDHLPWSQIVILLQQQQQQQQKQPEVVCFFSFFT